MHGDAPFDVELPFPIPLEDLGAHTPGYTANRPVNAIPYVCAAPPGILVTDRPPADHPGRSAMTSVGIVTGAASGIGAACARRLAGTVDVLLLADLKEAAARRRVSRSCATSPIRPRWNGSRREPRRSATLRTVVHSAGISPTMGDWRRILDVDLVATARLVDALRPLATTGTAIVCFASMAAHLNPRTTNAAADAAIDDPLAADLFDRYLAALGEAAEDPGNAYAWAKRGVQRLVVREAVALGRSARASVRSRPA